MCVENETKKKRFCFCLEIDSQKQFDIKQWNERQKNENERIEKNNSKEEMRDTKIKERNENPKIIDKEL
jgi:hypothetical protein